MIRRTAITSCVLTAIACAQHDSGQGPVQPGPITVADFNLGTHWFGPEIGHDDLTGKVVRDDLERRKIVRIALDRLRELDAALKDVADARTQLATAYDQIGDLHGSEWFADPADAEVGRVAYARAAELWRAALVAANTDVERAELRGNLTKSLSMFVHGCRKTNRSAEGAAAADEAVAVARAIHTAKPGDSDAVLAMVHALWARGDLHINLEPRSQGLADTRHATRLLEGLDSTVRAQPSWQRVESFCYFRLGLWVQHELNGKTKALEHYEHAVDLVIRSTRADPLRSDGSNLFVVVSQQARALEALGRRREARERAELGLRVLDEVHGRHGNVNTLCYWTYCAAMATNHGATELRAAVQDRWQSLDAKAIDQVDDPAGVAVVLLDMGIDPRPLRRLFEAALRDLRAGATTFSGGGSHALIDRIVAALAD